MRKPHEQQSTLNLTTLPQESLRALKKAVAQRSNWRIMTGGTDDQPRFVIEKSVRYDFLRGLPMVAHYHIAGSLQTSQYGATTLHYVVSGQSGVPLLHAAFNITPLLVLTFIISIGVFSPSVGVNWSGILLLGVLFVAMGVFGVFAYRSYQGHLRELNRFMEEFAQQTANR